MTEHPIQGLMSTAMTSIREMVDVNTIVGDAVQAPDGTVIIPISRVSFGFAAGGGEYNKCNVGSREGTDGESTDSSGCNFPFAGGSGAGVSISPVAFMVVGQEKIKLLPVNVNSSIDKILDLLPEIFNKANEAIKKKISVKKEIKTDDSVKKVEREVEDE
jgi:sporulation protein YtfJ